MTSTRRTGTMDADAGRGTLVGTAAASGRTRSVTSPGSSTASVGPRRSPSALVARSLVAILRFYQRFVSPLFPPSCRFHPTCSSYAIEALREHGLLRGSALTLVRLAKCAPWHPGGLDPVPPRGRPRAKQGAGAGPVTEERATP